MKNWLRKIAAGSVALAVIVTLSLLIWWGTKKWRIHQAVQTTRTALLADDIRKTAEGIRLLEQYRRNHPFLPVFRAQFYSRYAPHQAPPFWEEAINQHPKDSGLKTAYALNLIEIGALENAESRVRRWLKKDAAAPAHLRSALAVAFAMKNHTWAQHLAERLLELEPSSPINQVNLAALYLSDPDATQHAQALDSLLKLVQIPEVEVESLRLLMQYATRHQDDGLFNRLRRMKELNDPDVAILFLEAGARMGHPPDRDQVREIWNHTSPGSLERSRLGGWLVSQGLGEWMIDLTGDDSQRWFFPVGLPLAEAHLQAGRINEALSGLSASEWPGLEYLRFFVRARLAAVASPEASDTFLQLALKRAAESDNPWKHLYETGRSWKWLDGMIAVARFAIRNTPPESPRFNYWIEQVTLLRDVEGLLEASEVFLGKNPDHAPALNNAAYCAFLKRRDLGEALTRARRAYELSPQTTGIPSTLLFLEIEHGNLEKAEHLLKALAVDDPHRRLGQLYLNSKMGAIPDPELRQKILEHSYYWREEEILKYTLIKDK